MPQYIVNCELTLRGSFVIEAESPDDALDKAKDGQVEVDPGMEIVDYEIYGVKACPQ